MNKRIDNAIAFICASICFGALLFSGADQMADEQKSADALSNAIYIEQLDRAEARRQAQLDDIQTTIAAAGNEMPDKP